MCKYKAYRVDYFLSHLSSEDKAFLSGYPQDQSTLQKESFSAQYPQLFYD